MSIAARRAAAIAIDTCIAMVPALAMGMWWAAAISAGANEGVVGLLLYGLPALLFTGPVVLWVLWVRRTNIGKAPRRSIGLVLAALSRDDSGALHAEEGPSTPRGIALGAGASAIATLSIVAFGFEVFSIGAIIYGALFA